MTAHCLPKKSNLMKHLLAIFLAALCATASAQTIRSLGYNSTNGAVVANTGTNVLTFTNDVKFGNDTTISGAVISGSGVSLSFEDGELSGSITLTTNSSISFQGASAAITRSNLSLTLPALTNTSNAAAMRQLAGSTNSSHPFSGTFAFTNPDNNLTYAAVVSNGIILEIYEY